MICKNCIHYDVCNYHIDEETSMTVNECGRFMHKDQYVLLPVYVSQPVWYIRTLQKYLHEERKWETLGYELEEGKVSMLQQKVDKSWKIRVTINSSVSDYTIEDFNKYLFTNKPAAEAELRKREQELEYE